MFRRCLGIWRHRRQHDHRQEEEGKAEEEVSDYETATEEDFEERGRSKEDCKICTEPKSTEEMFHGRTCSHVYCRECIGQYVTVKVHDNVCKVKCPGEKCKAVLDMEQCKSLVSPDVFETWGRVLCESSIDRKHRLYCPFKDCSLLMVNDGKERVTEAVCKSCRRTFCAKCKVPWHSGMKCKEYQKLGKDEREPEDLMFLDLAKNNKWRRCPNCKFYVQKKEGCVHMTCRCHYHFCYTCGAKWSSGHENCSKRS